MAKKKANPKIHKFTLTEEELYEVLAAVNEQLSAQWDEIREMDDDMTDEQAAEQFTCYRKLQRLYNKFAPKEK